MTDPRDPDSGADIRGLGPGLADVVQREIRARSPEMFRAPDGQRVPGPKYDDNELAYAYARQRYMAGQVAQRMRELKAQEEQDAHACKKQPGSIGLAGSGRRAG